MFRLTVTLPSGFTVTFDTGSTPIPPSNLRELSSFARSDELSPTHNTHANTNLLLVIDASSFHPSERWLTVFDDPRAERVSAAVFRLSNVWAGIALM